MHAALLQTEHRPWPLPNTPWVGRQSWQELLFAHWPIEVQRVRHLVPPELTIQQFGGSTWIGLVPFQMRGAMLRGLPDVPGFSAFHELNVRFYVELEGKAGVWFSSLDADQALAVWGARALLHLPYQRAVMSLRHTSEGVDYRSARRDGRARFAGIYRPVGDVYTAAVGSLDEWLTERYCLYAQTPRGHLRRTEVHHVRWPLRRAELRLLENTMFEPLGIEVSGEPLCHFAQRQDVVVWAPEPCSRRSWSVSRAGAVAP
jgi:uncharacterized protein YqjF (DUF2071 family)